MATSGSFRTSGYSDADYPDGYVFSWSLISQSVEGNYSDINWSVKGDGGKNEYYFTNVKEKYVTVNGSTQSNSDIQQTFNYTYPFSGSARIYHNSDGTKSFSASCGGAFFYYGSYNSTGSGSWDLPTIPRQANITSAPNFSDEQNPTINYENKAGNSVSSLQACISLTGASDDIAYRDISKTGTSYTFNLTETERNVLRNATKNSNSRNVTFFIKTVIGGNTFHSTLTRTLSIVNANPTFTTSNVTYQDINSSVVAITKNNQHIVQNKSNLRINYTGATMKKGATISSYVFELNGVTKYGANDIADFGAVNSSSNLTLTATAVDSRGNKTSVKKTISILPYSVPTALVTLNRLNNYEDESYLTVDGSVASVNSKNTMAIKYRYKLSGGSYNNFVTINDNVKQTLTLNKNNEYIFNVVVTDAFNEKFDKEFVLGKGVFPLFIDVEKNSLGINCFPTNEKAIEIAGDDGNNEVIFGMKTGSWTPKLEALSETAPTITYSYQQGDYVKIGKMVFIAVYLRGTLSKLNGTNNYACITGLPFTPKNYVGGKCAFSLGTIYNALDITDNNDNLMAFINDGLIRLNRYNGAGACPLKVTPSGSYFVIGLSGWYEIE